jgi:hypothetical protein
MIEKNFERKLFFLTIAKKRNAKKKYISSLSFTPSKGLMQADYGNIYCRLAIEAGLFF